MEANLKTRSKSKERKSRNKTKIEFFASETSNKLLNVKRKRTETNGTILDTLLSKITSYLQQLQI